MGNAAPPILETPGVFICRVKLRRAADDDKDLQLRASYVIKLTHLISNTPARPVVRLRLEL